MNSFESLQIKERLRTINNYCNTKKYCNSLYIGVDKCQQGNYNPKGDKDVWDWKGLDGLHTTTLLEEAREDIFHDASFIT